MTVEIDLRGRRVLVVGGSAGIGRAAALSAAAAGAEIAVVGRSAEKLAEVVTSAGGGTAIVADVRDPGRCASLVEEAAAALGAFDAVVLAPGITWIQLVGKLEPAALDELFATNTLGPTLVADAALPHLADDGLMLFLSSVSVGDDYVGNGAYAASKAALDRFVRTFQLEHPAHRFVRASVGDTFGTDISRSADQEQMMELLPTWLASAVMFEQPMDAADLGQALAELIAVLLAHPGITVPNLTVVPPGARRTGTMEQLLGTMEPAAE